jgi:hypothetical protein
MTLRRWFNPLGTVMPKIRFNIKAAYYAQLRHWLTEETGYQWIQGTKPQTLAYALTDSTHRACGMDRGKIPRLERLRRRLRAPIL